MSQCSKMKHRRDQWKHKATQRGERERYQRKQHARLQAAPDRVTTALKKTQARLRQLEAQLHGLATLPKVDVVHVALRLFLDAPVQELNRQLAVLETEQKAAQAKQGQINDKLVSAVFCVFR